MAIYDTAGDHSNRNENAVGNAVYYQSLPFGDPLPTNASGFLSYDGRDFLYFLEIECTNPLSIEDFDLNSKIKLFPNPSTNFITVSNLETTANYSILSQLGKEIEKGNMNNNDQIDVSNLRKGLYFLAFEDGNTIKFIKE